jgi:hypothetical protein
MKIGSPWPVPIVKCYASKISELRCTEKGTLIAVGQGGQVLQVWIPIFAGRKAIRNGYRQWQWELETRWPPFLMANPWVFWLHDLPVLPLFVAKDLPLSGPLSLPVYASLSASAASSAYICASTSASNTCSAFASASASVTASVSSSSPASNTSSACTFCLCLCYCLCHCLCLYLCLCF